MAKVKGADGNKDCLFVIIITKHAITLTYSR